MFPTIVTDTGLLTLIGRLRVESWRADGELPSFANGSECWTDNHDLHAVNWAIMNELGTPIAAARMCVHFDPAELPDTAALAGYEHILSPPIAAFNRLVVHPTYRGRGFSVSLDHVRLREAQRMNCSTAVVVTHLAHRARQLNVLGFVNVGVSQHRTVSYAPSNVLVKKFGGSQ